MNNAEQEILKYLKAKGLPDGELNYPGERTAILTMNAIDELLWEIEGLEEDLEGARDEIDTLENEKDKMNEDLSDLADLVRQIRFKDK